MAGPTFSFWYSDFTDAMVAQLESLLRPISRQFHRLTLPKGRELFGAELFVQTSSISARGMIGIHIRRWPDDYYPRFVADVFRDELASGY